MENKNIARLAIAGTLAVTLGVPAVTVFAQDAGVVPSQGKATDGTTSSANATQDTGSVSSSSTGAYKKNQVIYVKEDGDGNKTGVYVVNGFSAAKDTVVQDAGAYESITNLTSTESLTNIDGTVQIEGAGEQEAVYQGDLSTSTELPWTVDVNYQLDGKDISAKDLAGKSGKLVMELTISPNSAYSGTGDYANNYLVQAVGQLKNSEVHQIEAANATMAVNGSNTQLTYMVLPGASTHYTVTADVEDFEFDGWQIVGVPMSLALDIDEGDMDTSSLTELSSGIATANSGAQAINEGAGQLSGGLTTLREKMGGFADGTAALKSGIAVVQNGIDQSAAGASQLQAGATSLSAALSGMQGQVDQSRVEIKQQAEAVAGDLTTKLTTAGGKAVEAAQTAGGLAQGLAGTTVGKVERVQVSTDGLTDEQAAAVQAAVAQANAQIDAANAQIDATNGKLQGFAASAQSASASAAEAATELSSIDTTALSSLSATLDSKLGQLSAGLGEAAGSNGAGKLAAGSETLAQGLNKLSAGTGELSNGAAQIDDGATQLTSGVEVLSDGASTLASGSTELAAGTQELTDRTSDLDAQVIDTIKSQIESMLNPQFVPTDFVNGEQGDHIGRVQFVYMTGAISK